MNEIRTIFAHGESWVPQSELQAFAREVLDQRDMVKAVGAQGLVSKKDVELWAKAEELAGPSQGQLA
jgi:hypothetical protein